MPWVHAGLENIKKVILAGCFSGVEEDQAWEVTTRGAQPVPTLSCETEEADTRVWLHVLRSPGIRKLVCSPDTGVYQIGLPLMYYRSLDVFVRISVFSSQEHHYLSLNSLTTSLLNDPDLSSIPRDLLPKVLQTLYAQGVILSILPVLESAPFKSILSACILHQ